MPPPILGLGNGNGYQMFIEDRGNLGYGALQDAVAGMQGAISQTPGMGFPITSYQANVPQLDAEVDRVKAKAQGVPLTELFDTLQTYLGSTYVNDFNKFGRTRSEEHTSELQSLMRISYAVFCLKKKNKQEQQ